MIFGLLLLGSCGEEDALQQRCGRADSPASCERLEPNAEYAGHHAAGHADAGSVVGSSVDGGMGRDAAASQLPDGMIPEAGRQCRAPTRYFASAGCPTWSFNPEIFPVATTGCFVPCARVRDPVCPIGRRCGQISFAPTVCGGTGCTSVCAETWACLPEHLFDEPSDADGGSPDWFDDAGVVLDEDAGF